MKTYPKLQIQFRPRQPNKAPAADGAIALLSSNFFQLGLDADRALQAEGHRWGATVSQ